MEELAVLVTRTQSGDMEAYGEIVRRFQDMAYGYGYSILGDFTAAEDAAQESFIQAYKELGHLREPQAFPGWFRRIVYTQCAMMARRNRTKAVALDEVAEMPSQVGDPHELAEKSELRDRVLDAIRALPENERVVTTLFYINGYSHDDIAGFLEVPLSTVKSRLHTARRRLKERMFDMVSDSLHSSKLPDDFDRRVIRKVILGLRKVDWSDVARQNEYLNCVISAMEVFGKKYDYDYLACISGCAFRGCSPIHEPNPGIYHVAKDIAIIEHTFRMLGCPAVLHARSDFGTDRKLIMDSVDKGIPVLTLGGVVNCSECCLISGYDDDGSVLLGYSPFMYIQNDHDEPADPTGYFRKSNWHDGYFEEAGGQILILGEPTAPLSEEEIIRESLKMAVKLIRGTASQSDFLTGYEGHTRYAELVCEDTDDWFGLYLMILCANKLYQDKLYVPQFLRGAKDLMRDKAEILEEGAELYDRIAELRHEMSQHVAEDFSMDEGILDKEVRRQYAECVYKIRDLEKHAADLFEKV